MTRREDFEVVNRIGTVLYTSPDLELARKWAKANGLIHPGLKVERVTTTITREPAYTPRLSLVRAAA